MRYEVYTINGLHAVARSQGNAIKLAADLPANCNGNAGILVKYRRYSYPSAGIQVLNGMPVRHTMLLYPPDSKCRQYRPEEWLQVLAPLASGRFDWAKDWANGRRIGIAAW